MMKKIILLCFLAAPGFNQHLAAQEWGWMFSAQSVADTEFNAYAWPTAMVNDAEGNVYMNGVSFYSATTLGNQLFTGSSWMGRNLLVKFNSAGAIQWINDNGATSTVNATGLATDAAGNVYTAGEFTGTYNYQGFTFSSGDSPVLNGFISKMNNNGTVQWTKQMSITGNPQNQDEYINRFIRPYDIAVDSSGNLFVCGQMRGVDGIFDGVTVPNVGEADTFIAKYDNNGNILWVKTVTEYGYQGHRKLVCDSMGNVYMAGSHDGTFGMSFGETPLGGGEASYTFIAKYSPDGDMVWLQSYGGSTTKDIFCYNMAIDANDNIYTVGYHDYTSLAFGDVVLTPANTGHHHGYVTKCDSNGVVQWAKSHDAFSYTQDVAAGNNGAVYIMGSFISPQIAIGDTTLVNEGNSNAYVAKIDEGGDYVWAEQMGGSSHSETYLATDNANNSLYIFGSYSNIRLGAQTYTAATSGEMFVSKLETTALGTAAFNTTAPSLYPNPAQDILNIPGIEAAPFSVRDVMGRIVAQGYTDAGRVDVSLLPSGIYLLNINNMVAKFIKE